MRLMPENPGADDTEAKAVQKYHQSGSPWEVLLAFAKLGVSCFGGPIAHIGYFREEFVVRRRWIDEPAFADVVALCQFLPGPASSQVGFSIGLMRAGYLGDLAAWTAFTLPWRLSHVSGYREGDRVRNSKVVTHGSDETGRIAANMRSRRSCCGKTYSLALSAGV